MTADLQIRLFGGLEIRQGNVPITAFISNKAPALLGYLAVVGRPVQRELLATLFWGEMGDGDAKNNLRQVLTSLRKVLDPYLDITRESVALRTESAYWLDVAEFAHSIKGAAHLPPEAHIARLTAATMLYRGDLFEGVLLHEAPDFEDWLTMQRARLRELALNALHELVGLQMAEARFADAIDSATRLLALDPWREEAHRQLMLALARTGQRSAALTQYEQCRRTMRAVFDVEPAIETSELAEQIKMALRGLRHNLLPPINAFVGRNDELRVLRRLLADPTARLVTLIGPGGIGKTRLAMQAAAERIDYHLGGVWFVSLIPVGDADDIIPAILTALRIPTLGVDNLLQTLVNYLRHRDALLILDNFEHALTPANLDSIARLLTDASMLCILVTSRVRLQMQAERIVEIEGLPSPAPDDDPAAETFAAVELLVRRAQQQDAAFALTVQNKEVLAQICRAVDGMPLAIELAAAWLRTLAIDEVLSEIAHSADILTSTMHDAPPRHRSLRAVFASSWRMLAAEEQAVYAGAAIFRGGFDAGAARAVVDATPATLARLVDHSLLRRTADGRYRRHPLLLQFAVEQLHGDPLHLARTTRRHVAYFAHFLKLHTPALYGAGQPDALNAVRRELDNIWQAWQLAGEQRAFSFFADTLDALLLVFDIAGLIQVARDLCRLAGQQLAAVNPTSPAERIVLARVQAMEGVFEFRVGNFARARALTEEALDMLCDEQADPWVLGHAYIFLGGAYFGLGDLKRTLAEFHRALDAYTAADSAWGRATALGNIAEMHMVAGNEAAALDYAQRAQVIAEPTGNAYLLVHNTYRLAVLLANAGEYAAAQRYQRASLDYAEQLDYTSGIGMATASLGDIAFATGEYAVAAQHFADAVELHRTAGNWMDEARCLVRQAEAALAQEQYEPCRSLLHTALRKAMQADAHAVQMDALLQVARLWLQQQRSAEAAALLDHVAAAPASTVATRTIATELLAAYTSRQSRVEHAKSQIFSLAHVLAHL